jgi:hypothetical protein
MVFSYFTCPLIHAFTTNLRIVFAMISAIDLLFAVITAIIAS